MRYFPMQAIAFGSKARFKELFLPADRMRNGEFSYVSQLLRKLAAGGAAGATGLSVIYPMDVARTRMASDTAVGRKYRGLFDCLRRIVRVDGFRGVYRGYLVSIAGIVPYRAAYFGLYDHAMSRVKGWKATKMIGGGAEDVKMGFWTRWAISQTTSVISQFVAYPFDTVRRRMQVGEGETLYRNSRECFRMMVKEEGWTSLYIGCWVNVVRATGCALCLVFYDSIGKFLFLDKDYGGH